MSKVALDVAAPTVIDESLIRKAIYVPPSPLDNVTGGANSESKKDGMEFHEVECLIFSFKNILKINHLVGFENLTKLQLDNNVIEKIENLGHLTNLTWLDLSFNNIQKIEGLETLTKLTDLSLFNNKISVLENMDTLTDLQVLSIGNNKFSAIENLMYLRRFKELRLVNLAGNPVCRDPEYKNYVLAHVRNIKYLNYRLVDESEITTARETFQEELLELEEKEAIEQAKIEEEKEEEAQRQLIRSANLEGVDNLFDDMFLEDAEFSKLNVLTTLVDPLAEYKEKLEPLTSEFKKFVLDQFQKKADERGQFEGALDEAKKINESDALTLIEEFNSKRKRVLRNFKMSGSTDVELLKKLRAENDALSDELLELEMQQVEQFEEVIREFERNMGDIHSANMETIQNYFTRLRDLENSFHDTATSLVLAEWDKFHKNQTDEPLSEEAKNLLMDKDTLTNILNGSHDTRTAKIDNKEDDITTQEQKKLEELMQTVKVNENQRNRDRVSEIWGLVERNKTEIDEYLLAEEDGGM